MKPNLSFLISTFIGLLITGNAVSQTSAAGAGTLVRIDPAIRGGGQYKTYRKWKSGKSTSFWQPCLVLINQLPSYRHPRQSGRNKHGGMKVKSLYYNVLEV